MTRLTENDIQRFAGLSGIRRKPIVYCGPVDENGLWTIWREPGDNTVDRALAGQNKTTHLIMDTEPNTYWVRDEGDGIPVGKKEFVDERGKKEQLSTFYVVTGLTHGGSNFNAKQASRGTHGLGIKVTNALSTYYKQWTFRDGQWWAIEYKKGVLTKDVHKSSPPKLPHKIKAKSGTVVCFKPDMSIFTKNSKMPLADARSWCELSSYLVPKLKVLFTDSKGKTTTYFTKRGPLDYLDKQQEKLKCEFDGKPFVHQSKLLDIAIAFSNADGCNINAYTNGLHNPGGGKHVEALEKALFDSLKPYGSKNKKKAFKREDLQEGLVGLVNAKLAAPTFSNQRKDLLNDERVMPEAYPELKTAFDAYWKTNKALAKRLCAKAIELSELTKSFKASKKMVSNVRKAMKKQSAKLSDIVGNAPLDKREIFICEGDSAAGGLKQARDKTFQAVFPLKGKMLNVLKAAQAKINNNKEVVDLLAALGIDLSKKEFKPRYGKFIILTDADDDGNHIACLVATFFWKFTPQLFKKGTIYIGVSPRYRCVLKDKTYFGQNKEKLRAKYGPKADITYLKGLGELQPEQLYEVATNPKTRKLIQISYPKDKKDIRKFERMMGSDPVYNKLLLGINRDAVK